MDHVGDGDGGGGEDHRGGSRGLGRGNWTSNPPPLRRPHHPVGQDTASVNQINEMFNNVSMNDVVKNSDLSAEAAEFVPRSMMNTQMQQQQQHNQFHHRSSVQDRLVAARNSHPDQQNHQYSNQQQFPYHYQQMPYQPYVESQQHSHGYSHYEGSYNNYDRHNHDNRNMENRSENTLQGTLSQLNTAMQTLTRNPDQFENLVVPLVSSITPHLKNAINTRAVVSAVILKCISDTNFRYSGARLITHLDAVDTSSDDAPTIFRTELYDRCREEAKLLAETWPKITQHSFEDERKCHGLMLSLAELVAQMDSQPASILGKLLIEVLSTALKNPGPNSAKFICQSLKLSGQYLERDSSANREEIERVMKELSSLVIEGRVDAHIGRMVNNVKELRNGNWGRGVSSHGPTPVEINQRISQNQVQHQMPQQQLLNQHQHQQQIQQHHQQQQQQQHHQQQQQQQQHQQQQQQQQYQSQFDEPVLYGPDGMILSAEERRFCQDLANLDDDIDESFAPWQQDLVNEIDPDEEDEDDIIAAAYEEFLKLPPNNISNQIKRGK